MYVCILCIYIYRNVHIYVYVCQLLMCIDNIIYHICVCVCVWPPLQHVPTFDGQMPLLPQTIAMEVGKVDHIRSYHTSETWQTGVYNRDNRDIIRI